MEPWLQLFGRGVSNQTQVSVEGKYSEFILFLKNSFNHISKQVRPKISEDRNSKIDRLHHL